MMNPSYTPEFSPLGKKVDYQDQYDASLLFPIARQQKRDPSPHRRPNQHLRSRGQPFDDRPRIGQR